MSVKATFDLGWAVARLNATDDILELWTPPDYDPLDQTFKKECQYIIIQGKNHLETLRAYLEQYYPGEGESEK